MGLRKKHVKISFVVLLFLGSVVGGFGFFCYKRLSDFKRDLALLVKLKTHGEYQLHIEKDRFDWQNLLLELYEVSLVNVSDTNQRGIQSINIPYVQINLGDLHSLLSDKQLVINSLVIEEPIVHVAAKGKGDQIQQVNIGQTLLKIYPAVTAMLEHFSIHSFVINRGNLRIQQSARDSLQFQFIDFLVHEWNMKHLTKDSRIHLEIDGQHLRMGSSSFAFSSIEFNYPQHLLSFRNFSFESEDSVSHSHLKVEGKAVLIQGLDYEELYKNQRYKLKKIKIEQPKITGKLFVEKGKGKKKQHPLAQILKQAFGEAHLDTAIIDKASIDLVLQHGSNAIRSRFPQVDFSLTHFGIIQDSADLQVGDLQIHLDHTAIRLNQDIELRCKDLQFVRGHFLEIKEAYFYKVAAKKPFIQCEKIHLEHFKLLNFVFKKHIFAESIRLENADIQLSPEILALLPKPSPDSAKAESKKQLNIHIGAFSLYNVGIRYHDKKKDLVVKGLTTEMEEVHSFSPEEWMSQLKLVKVGSISFHDQDRLFKGEVQKLSIDRRQVVVQKISLSYDQLNVQGKDISLIRSAPYHFHKVYHWDQIAFGSFQIKGRVPTNRGKTSGDSSASLPDFSIKEMAIKQLTADLDVKGKKISFLAENFHGQEIKNKENVFPYGYYSGKINHFQFRDSITWTQVDSFLFNSHSRSTLYHVQFRHKEMEAQCDHVQLGKLGVHEGNTSLAYMKAIGVEVKQRQLDLLNMDSLVLHSLRLVHGKKPHIGEILAYHSIIHVPKAKDTQEEKKKAIHIPFDLFDQISLFRSEVVLAENQKLKIHQIEGSGFLHHPFLAIDSLSLETEKVNLQMDGFALQNKTLSIHSFQVVPTPWFASHQEWEGDLITGIFSQVSLSGFQFDSLLNSQAIVAHELKLGQVYVDVRRDKRLKDPPAKEKPFQLCLFIPPLLHLDQLKVEDGDIRYREISEKTGEEGEIELNDLQASIKSMDPSLKMAGGIVMEAKTRLYDAGYVRVRYTEPNPDQFRWEVGVSKMDLKLLNRITLPLQAIEIKSGVLDTFHIDVTADKEQALGFSIMGYHDLHLAIMKQDDPQKKNVGTELLSFLADGIVLKHEKEMAKAPIKQARLKEKAIFNYWAKIASHGATNAILHGKQEKTEKLARKK